MRNFLDPYDTRLNLLSKEIRAVELSLSVIKSIMDDMRRIASGKRDEEHPDRATLVGICAPQLGELVRVILVDIAADPMVPNFTPNFKFFINPIILTSSIEENLGREGCFSTGKIGGAVYRSDSVEVAAVDESGKPFEYKSSNPFISRILQHEIDHLNGIRFPARIRRAEHLHYVDLGDFQNYRDNWATWTKFYPFEKWLKMYEGKPK